MAESKLYTRFARIYEDIAGKPSNKITEECGELREILDEKNVTNSKTIIELACGTAPYYCTLIDVCQYVGVDLNREMLQVAQKEHTQQPSVVQGDMRALPVTGADVVLVMFNSLLIINTKEELKRLAETIFESLETGGILISEVSTVPKLDPESRSAESTGDKLDSGEKILHSEVDMKTVVDNEMSRKIAVVQVIQTTIQSQRITHHYTEIPKDGDPTHYKDEFIYTLFTEAELCEAMQAVGFSDVEYRPAEFTHGALIARKPEQ